MKVLLAVDGSRYSDMCISAVKHLGLKSTSRLTVLTVIPEQTFLGGLHINKLWQNKDRISRLRQIQEESAQAITQRVVSQVKTIRPEIDEAIAWGKPDEVILKFAHQDNFDLLVIGAKGLANSDRFPLGTVTTRIIKHANCSVLVVKEDIKKIRRILIGTDGSLYSQAAEDFIIKLSPPRKTDIFVVTALQSHMPVLVKMPTMDIDTNREIIADLQLAESLEAAKIIKKSEVKFHAKGYEVTSLVRNGEPSSEILSCANTFNPEVVVVGAKGLSGIESFLMGSVSKRVARFSRYSVLIVRPQKEK